MGIHIKQTGRIHSPSKEIDVGFDHFDKNLSIPFENRSKVPTGPVIKTPPTTCAMKTLPLPLIRR